MTDPYRPALIGAVLGAGVGVGATGVGLPALEAVVMSAAGGMLLGLAFARWRRR